MGSNIFLEWYFLLALFFPDIGWRWPPILHLSPLPFQSRILPRIPSIMFHIGRHVASNQRHSLKASAKHQPTPARSHRRSPGRQRCHGGRSVDAGLRFRIRI